MGYLIKNQKGLYHSGASNIFVPRNRAMIWKDKEKAEKVKKNLPIKIKSECIVIKEDNMQKKAACMADYIKSCKPNPQVENAIKETGYMDMQLLDDLDDDEYDLDYGYESDTLPSESVENVSFLYGNIKSIIEAGENLENRINFLTEKLSVTVRSIVDIEHAIEIKDPDEVYNAEYLELMHNKLKERREIKDELFMLNLLQTRIFTKDNVQLLRDKLDKMENRTYHPRILFSLFTDCEEENS